MTWVNTSQDNVKIFESCGPHFVVGSEKESHTRCKPVKTKPANKHVRNTTEKQKENLSFVFALFLLMTCCVSLSNYQDWLNFHTLFLFPDDYFKSVVVNKPLC